MTIHKSSRLKALFLLGAAAVAFAPLSTAHAQAQANRSVAFSIGAQDLGGALTQLGRDSGRNIVFSADLVRGKRTTGYRGQGGVTQALTVLLAGSGLTYRVNESGTYLIARAAQDAPVTPRRRPAAPPPQAAETAPVQDSIAIEDVIVTARRREERIIDVPISVSAFSQEQLEDLKIEGGAELLRAIPNVNFSKDNFTGYNFSIRGIGTKVLSSTADPAVAISFNNTALLRNRLFEQEYFDVQRLEVLRGPQGTLYGRNATAGVVNMLPNLPELGEFSGSIQGELGNYDSQRARGYINIPLGDTLAVRFAGAMTRRDGFDYNTVTEQSVNGRDLWATRVGVAWRPTSSFRANFLWEHFGEDDDRSRTGKQLCTRGVTPQTIDYRGGNGQAASADVWKLWTRSALTPGCQAKSLFTDEAYGVADSFGSPFVAGLINVSPYNSSGSGGGYLTNEYIDPFNTGDGTQSRDLREISTKYDPVFRAENDIFQLNLEWDLTPGLTLYSQTLYMEDSYYGSQDFLRTQPQSGVFRPVGGGTVLPWFDMNRNPYGFGFPGEDSAHGGIFCDPQLGCLDHAAAVDISQSESEQFSQEFRLSSSFDGPFNYSVGANYLKFKTREDYYIFSNLITIIAMREIGAGAAYNYGNDQGDEFEDCTAPGTAPQHLEGCMYIDPNPIDQVNGDGHNYIRNVSINETESWALFGEGYWNIRDNLRLTAGLRYTNDEKTVTPVPSQMLVTFDPDEGPQSIGRGLYREPDQVQSWGEFTGRVALDWKPVLDFTDETLVYLSYARGYKAGGGNPATAAQDAAYAFASLPRSFAPEFLNAFEAGIKNSLLGGRATLGVSAFFYDYTDYQVTQLIDRGFHTETFDTTVMGLELEGAWRPTRNLRIDSTLGYLHTSIANGEKSIDVMNRTAGNDDWIVVRPWVSSPFTCIVPKDIVGRYISGLDGPKLANPTDTQLRGLFYARYLCPNNSSYNPFAPGGIASGAVVWDPVNDAQGGGRGFFTDLGGHELPNAPALTFNIGVQYRMELPGGWDVTWRGDYYRQSQSYARVYNSEYDRLEGWGNANLSVTLTRDGSPMTAQLYVKNVLDDTPITDAFTGPDELGNFANVFTLDPRIIGLSVRAEF
jgi:iron complex outermembrane receptor protein